MEIAAEVAHTLTWLNIYQDVTRPYISGFIYTKKINDITFTIHLKKKKQLNITGKRYIISFGDNTSSFIEDFSQNNNTGK